MKKKTFFDKGENDKCLTCKKIECGSCNYRYELLNGSCFPTFSIKAAYEIMEENENIELINFTFSEYIIGIEIDENQIEPTYNHTFNSKGNHTVYISMNITELNSFYSMFSQIDTSIYFSKKLIQKI